MIIGSDLNVKGLNSFITPTKKQRNCIWEVHHRYHIYMRRRKASLSLTWQSLRSSSPPWPPRSLHCIRESTGQRHRSYTMD